MLKNKIIIKILLKRLCICCRGHCAEKAPTDRGT